MIVLQSIDPERLSNKEGSRGMQGSPWEEEIEYILQVVWGQVGMKTGGIMWVEETEGEITERDFQN
jgi:hypothetical protein